MQQRLTSRHLLLIGISLIAIIGLLLSPAIPQDPNYHQFADTRAIAGIANFWNVVSNLPFVLLGIYGLYRWRSRQSSTANTHDLLLCLGAILVGLGSAYYHAAPDNHRLIWDRLPITLVFMTVFSWVIETRVIQHDRSQSLWPLLSLGLASVLYWYWGEQQGVGDLRAYVLVQFLPLILIPLILLLFKGDAWSNRQLGWALICYVIAKGFEQFDMALFSDWHFGGHALKHLFASAAVLCLLRATTDEQLNKPC